MRTITILKPFLSSKIIFLFLLSVSFQSCEKQAVKPEEKPDPIENEAQFNRLIRVSNYGEALPEGSAPTSDQSAIYFNLESNIAINPDFKQSNRWDISFSGIYRSFLNCNSEKTGGTGKGAILLVKQKFEDVIDIPDEKLFRKGEKPYGTDDSGDFGEGLGWYIYDFTGAIKGDGTEAKTHICYPIPDRTLIIKTAKGNYAKIRILSIYKDLLNPKDWLKNSPKPYFTFEYVLVKAGSKTFEIKN